MNKLAREARQARQAEAHKETNLAIDHAGRADRQTTDLLVELLINFGAQSAEVGAQAYIFQNGAIYAEEAARRHITDAIAIARQAEAKCTEARDYDAEADLHETTYHDVGQERSTREQAALSLIRARKIAEEARARALDLAAEAHKAAHAAEIAATTGHAQMHVALDAQRSN